MMIDSSRLIYLHGSESDSNSEVEDDQRLHKSVHEMDWNSILAWALRRDPYLHCAHTCPPTPLRFGDNPGTARQGKCNGERCQGAQVSAPPQDKPSQG